MDKIRIGVIGTGSISREHLGAYAKNPHVEIYALCDINPGTLAKRAAEFGVERTFTSYEEMLRLPEIDAVSVCTWNSAHAPCTIAALNAGKHVLCEKPMAMNTQEALAMQAAAEKNGRLLMIGFVRRFGNDCDILQDLIAGDQLGEIYYAKATYLRRNGNPGSWFGDKARSGGGPLIDLGVHVIDLSRYLMGCPKPVSVYGAAFHKLGSRPGIKSGKGYITARSDDAGVCDVEDLATALIRFDNGAVISVEASFSLNIKHNVGSIELFGTRAGAKIDPELEVFSEMNGYMTNVTLDQPTALSFDGLFAREINHFVDCVRLGVPCRAPAGEGVMLMRILDAIYESAATGHEVIIKEDEV